jgi:succinoglycan biosynthesis transport protein ExoP
LVINGLLGYDDTRIDYDSPFLRHPSEYLDKEEYLNYKISGNFYSVNNYHEILEQNNMKLSYIPDFVLIELPPILLYPYPVGLISNADLPILVCRSNRVWNEADQGVLDILMKLTEKKTHFILNGVETLVIESVLGDLPRKRSRLRRAMKNLFRFQFFSKNQL